MPADDLASIPGLQEKHLRVLAELGATSAESLVATDPEAILHAMRRMRPAPGIDEIALWQKAAQAQLEDVAPSAAWDRVATFVVSFEQRWLDGGAERRIAAEQTELETEQAPEVWFDWDCAAICEWMKGHLDISPLRAGTLGSVTAPVDVRLGAGGGQGYEESVHIAAIRILDGDTSVDVTTGAAREQAPAVEISATSRIALTVGGIRPEQRFVAVLRLLRPGEHGRSATDPVPIDADGKAVLDLGALPAGVHRTRLLAWAASGPPAAVRVELPPLARRVVAGTQSSATGPERSPR